MRRARARIAATAAIAALLMTAAQTAPAAHCSKVFVFFGDDTIRTPYRVAGVDPGTVGCAYPLVHADTNRIPPGVTEAWAAVSVQDGTPSGGTMKGVALTWTLNSVRARYESQTVYIGTTGNVTATTTVGGSLQSVTYTR